MPPGLTAGIDPGLGSLKTVLGTMPMENNLVLFAATRPRYEPLRWEDRALASSPLHSMVLPLGLQLNLLMSWSDSKQLWTFHRCTMRWWSSGLLPSSGSFWWFTYYVPNQVNCHRSPELHRMRDREALSSALLQWPHKVPAGVEGNQRTWRGKPKSYRADLSPPGQESSAWGGPLIQDYLRQVTTIWARGQVRRDMSTKGFCFNRIPFCLCVTVSLTNVGYPGPSPGQDSGHCCSMAGSLWNSARWEYRPHQTPSPWEGLLCN